MLLTCYVRVYLTQSQIHTLDKPLLFFRPRIVVQCYLDPLYGGFHGSSVRFLNKTPTPILLTKEMKSKVNVRCIGHLFNIKSWTLLRQCVEWS